MTDLNEAFPNYKSPPAGAFTSATSPRIRSTPPPPKSWPQYNNTNIDETVEALKKEHPTLDIHKVSKNGGWTCDVRTDRVRVFYDPSTNLVSSIPQTG